MPDENWTEHGLVAVQFALQKTDEGNLVCLIWRIDGVEHALKAPPKDMFEMLMAFSAYILQHYPEVSSTSPPN